MMLQTVEEVLKNTPKKRFGPVTLSAMLFLSLVGKKPTCLPRDWLLPAVISSCARCFKQVYACFGNWGLSYCDGDDKWHILRKSMLKVFFWLLCLHSIMPYLNTWVYILSSSDFPRVNNYPALLTVSDLQETGTKPCDFINIRNYKWEKPLY